MPVVDTSYKRDYKVVHVDSNGVVLRPLGTDGSTDFDSLATYWKELVHAYYDDPDTHQIHVYLTQLPVEVLVVDAYVDYVVEYPRVEIHVGDHVIDVSDRVACNHPNPETPGLYALDFTLSIGGECATPIWRSWVSIDEPPVLRQIITPWNRESRPIVDLNRLVIEPQFNEALYEAGVPLYNFQQANAPAAVSQFNALSYKDARAIVKGKQLFITGPRLPVGTTATIKLEGGTIERVLGIGVMCPSFRSNATYKHGEVVSYGGYDYYAMTDIPFVGENGGSVIPDTLYEEDGVPVACWLRGAYYTTEDIDLADGECKLDSLWAVLDVEGYLFKMDLLRAFSVRHYWGHYNRKYFLDYAPGDLVSVVSDSVVSIYQRNDTSIDEAGLEEAYRPGHYLNPHWTEVYSEADNEMLRIPAIKPYSNATNAVVSKTYPVREEAFKIYARMVGMPMELVDAIGSKKSVLLWALLYRTRETFPGIRAAMRAIGLDIGDLERVYPSVNYYKDGDFGEEGHIKYIYEEIDRVKVIARSVEADKLWLSDGDPDLNPDDPRNGELRNIPWIRYSREGEIPDTVWTYDTDNNTWNEFYSFRHRKHLADYDYDISDKSPATYDLSVNNRYYTATVHLMDRLAEECEVDIDGEKWIDPNHIGSLSEALVALLEYEIPIYICFRLKIMLASVGHARVTGFSKGVVLWDAWGGPIGLRLFPGKYFDFRKLSVESYYPKVLYSYDNGTFEEYTDYTQGEGFRYFPFEQAVYLKFEYAPTDSGILFEKAIHPYWTSRYTIGTLGGIDLIDDKFKDACELGSDSEPLYLCKGIAAITVKIEQRTLDVEAESLMWQYVFDDGTGNEWSFDEVTPFAEFESVEARFMGYWSSDSEQLFIDAVDHVTTDNGLVDSRTEEIDGETWLCIGGKASKFYYLWDANGYVIGMLQVYYVDRMVLDGGGQDILRVHFV